MKSLKGLRCDIYKSEYKCALNVISYEKKQVTLVGEGIPEIHEASEDAPAVLLIVENKAGSKQTPRVKPIIDGGENLWFMFGGNFIYTHDSRFPFDHPIKLFDLYEK